MTLHNGQLDCERERESIKTDYAQVNLNDEFVYHLGVPEFRQFGFVKKQRLISCN